MEIDPNCLYPQYLLNEPTEISEVLGGTNSQNIKSRLQPYPKNPYEKKEIYKKGSYFVAAAKRYPINLPARLLLAFKIKHNGNMNFNTLIRKAFQLIVIKDSSAECRNLPKP